MISGKLKIAYPIFLVIARRHEILRHVAAPGYVQIGPLVSRVILQHHVQPIDIRI